MTNSTGSSLEPKKQNKGQFQKGQSGNPAGRPSRKSFIEAMVALGIDVDLADVIKKVHKQAMEGCTTSQNYLISRRFPQLKPSATPTPFQFTATEFADRVDEVLHQIAAGVISTDDGGRVISSIVSAERAKSSDENENEIIIIGGLPEITDADNTREFALFSKLKASGALDKMLAVAEVNEDED